MSHSKDRLTVTVSLTKETQLCSSWYESHYRQIATLWVTQDRPTVQLLLWVTLKRLSSAALGMSNTTDRLQVCESLQTHCAAVTVSHSKDRPTVQLLMWVTLKRLSSAALGMSNTTDRLQVCESLKTDPLCSSYCESHYRQTNHATYALCHARQTIELTVSHTTQF